MTLRIAVSGLACDARASGVRARLLGWLRELAPMLAGGEEVSLLWSASVPLPDLPPAIAPVLLPIPPAPAWRRALGEWHGVGRALAERGVDLLDQGHLPLVAPRNVGVVLTVHDLRDLGPFRRRPRWLARAVLMHALRRARCVVVPSATTAQGVRALGVDPARLQVVPNAVPRELAGVVRETPRHFLHVGHLEARKNLGMLLEAYARLRAVAPAAPPLVLAGHDAGAGPALRARSQRLGIAERVTLPGAVPPAALRELYAGAAAVCVPSHEEGHGMAALEGLAAGAPVLVSECGALPETVGEHGTVLPPDDPAAWALALRAALLDRDPRRAAARRAFATRFTWHDAAARILALWRGVSRG
ncbi:MAG: glycosyltransferase [Planctomycetes bacterium]|nr:glycosyltransferase [Planctomycetota bacterium]